jgi:glycosyltransferase involved in cell wall biosynthesis
MQGISVVIITYNESLNITRCIRSVTGIADEVIVVDSFSEDNTVQLAEKEGAIVFRHKFPGYIEQKNFAVSKASNDYILSLDADEALSEELHREIVQIKKDLKFDGYIFNRRNNYCGQWINHSNWYPDRKLRLFNRKKGRWGGVNPHDRWIMNSGTSTCRVKADILHWVLKSYEEHLEKVNRFSSIAALEYHRKGKKTTAFKMCAHGGWRFFKAYFLRLGILDGYNGFVISTLSAYTSFLKYMKLRNLNNKQNRKTLDSNINIANSNDRLRADHRPERMVS